MAPKDIRKIFIVGSLLFLVVFGFVLLKPHTTKALSGSSFRAGHIIDDALFFDGDALSQNQIQNFLDTKVPDCDTNGDEEFGNTGMSRAEWTEANNRPEPPYYCLNEATFRVYSKTADSFCSGSITAPSDRQKAAYIIRVVAKACNISPKVLIVTLQKEQGLVSDDWPWPTQYAKAMGFGCPDSDLSHSDDSNNNGCYDDFEGFFNQVWYAARQFQRYVKQPQNFNHAVGQTSSLLSYGDSTPPCAKTNVLIETKATAALYNYTPYQPNKAALDNLYGSGNACSYYGNRNFWRYYNDWFGSTLASYKSKLIYKCCKVNTPPGVSKTITLKFQNVGSADWYDETGSQAPSAPFATSPVMLMTGRPVERHSAFADESWTGTTKPTRNFTAVYNSNGTTLASNQHMVSKNQIVKYTFQIDIPANVKPGEYREYFQPSVLRKSSLFNDPGAYIYMNIAKPIYKGQILGRDAYIEANPGEDVTSYVRIKNTGNMPWYDSSGIGSAFEGFLPTMLVTSNPLMHYHPYGSLWGDARNVPARMFTYVRNSDGSIPSDQHVVKPGQWARFDVDFHIPSSSGEKVKKDYFMLVGRAKVNGKWKIIPYSGTQTTLTVAVVK